MLRKLITITLALSLCGCVANSATQPTSMVETTVSTTQANTEVTILSTEEPQTLFDPYVIIDTMSPEELVGQLFLARYPEKEQALADVSQYHLGGYILFGKDFENETPQSISDSLQTLQAASDMPLLIAVDEEGGTVSRISGYSQFRTERFPSPRHAYAQGRMEYVLQLETEKANLLNRLGVNVNMAPVCDITTDPAAFMYSRSIGLDPQATGRFASDTASIMTSCGVGAVLKHFPGYGNNTDTHIGIAVDSRTLEVLESNDLVPFSAAITAGCDAILVSHTIIECLDNSLPASLSPAVITYLRRNMGFSGVVVTDDLVMQAITDRYGAGEAAVMAVAAGCDLLCSSEYEVQYEAVLNALNSGRLSVQRVKEAAARILTWKYTLGLLDANR